MMTKFVDTGKNRRYLDTEAFGIANTEAFGIAQSLASDPFSLYNLYTKSSIIASLIQKTDAREIQSDTSACVIELSMLLRKK